MKKFEGKRFSNKFWKSRTEECWRSDALHGINDMVEQQNTSDRVMTNESYRRAYIREWMLNWFRKHIEWNASGINSENEQGVFKWTHRLFGE